MQRTLVLLKPDAVQRGIVGEVVSRFEKAGLKIVGIKMLEPDEAHYHKHYEDISKMISRRGQEAFEVTLKFMSSGPVIALVLEGLDAVGIVRKITGDTEPSKALPGTIRGDYAHISIERANEKKMSVPNLIHASGDPDEAKAEIELWFSLDELHTYTSTHSRFTQN